MIIGMEHLNYDTRALSCSKILPKIKDMLMGERVSAKALNIFFCLTKYKITELGQPVLTFLSRTAQLFSAFGLYGHTESKIPVQTSVICS